MPLNQMSGSRWASMGGFGASRTLPTNRSTTRGAARTRLTTSVWLIVLTSVVFTWRQDGGEERVQSFQHLPPEGFRVCGREQSDRGTPSYHNHAVPSPEPSVPLGRILDDVVDVAAVVVAFGEGEAQAAFV